MMLQFYPAAEGDIPGIFEQAKDLIDTYEDLSSIDYEKVLHWVKRKIAANIGSYHTVKSDGEVCAYYRLCEDGEVDDLYVLPSFRNKGIGSEILKKYMEESKKSLYLYVFSRNIRAISFYERHGFSVREIVGKTRLIMERKG